MSIFVIGFFFLIRTLKPKSFLLFSKKSLYDYEKKLFCCLDLFKIKLKIKRWKTLILTDLFPSLLQKLYAQFAQIFLVFQILWKYKFGKQSVNNLRHNLYLILTFALKDFDGHVFCKQCIDEWLIVRKVCPHDRTALEQSKLRPVGATLKSMFAK